MSKLKVVIYFDYELQQGADMCTNPQKWGLDDYTNTEKLLELLNKYDVKVCFATLGTIAEGNKLPYSSKKQIKKIHSKGHEIASHSYKHNALDSLTNKEIISDLKKSKRLLESVIKEKIMTFVPPHNLPFNLLGIAIGLKKIEKEGKPTKRRPYISKRPISKYRQIINKIGFKVIREYDLIINKLDFTGFDSKVRNKILKNKNKNKIITCYGHPHALLVKGKQSLEELEKTIKLIKKEKIEVILPREIKRCLEKNGI
ncbi:polysaccharide deacetylase family protein [Candidatus Woesearchaeota archaeon]|nr:polysaccharide deacetylase family protein [Candidatus Woesearchaeota archaeon]